MPTTTSFTGSEASHSSAYSIQRLFLFWPVSGLKGRVQSAKIDCTLRTGTTFSDKNFNLCLFTDRIDQTNWSQYNAHTVYQYPGNSNYYFNSSRYSSFSNNFLCNQQVAVSLTGGAGNTAKSFTVSIPADKQSASLWNGKDVCLGFYETSGESSGMVWGTSQKATLTLTTTNGIVKYGVGGAWVDCEVYYGSNGSWVQVQPYYGSNGDWKEIGG